MRSNYKRLGEYIRFVDEKNDGMKVKQLLGINNEKYFTKAKTNTIGIDLSTYRIVRSNQFAFNRATTRNGEKISIALRKGKDCIVSPSYRVFEVVDENELLPEYLMMWFRRPEFDRYARFKSHGSAHEFFDQVEMCEVELPVPPIEKQRAIVNEYNTVVRRIRLNERLNQKLEETAQALYKHWFVDFEFPVENGWPYKSSGGEMVYCEELDKEVPKGWDYIPLSEITSKIGSGATPKGGKENYKSEGISLIRSLNVYDFNFMYDELAFIDTNQANKLSNVEVKEKDILLNITGVSVGRCCMVPSNILPARVNQHVMIIRLIEDINFAYSLHCALCSFENKSELLGISNSGSTRQAITKIEIEEFKVLLSDKKSRDQFEEYFKTFFELKNIVTRQNMYLNSVSEALLSQLSL